MVRYFAIIFLIVAKKKLKYSPDNHNLSETENEMKFILLSLNIHIVDDDDINKKILYSLSNTKIINDCKTSKLTIRTNIFSQRNQQFNSIIL